MLHFILKMYYCEWSIIKPNETSRESIHASVSRCSLLIYRMFLFEKLVVDTFESHLYSYKNKDFIMAILPYKVPQSLMLQLIGMVEVDFYPCYKRNRGIINNSTVLEQNLISMGQHQTEVVGSALREEAKVEQENIYLARTLAFAFLLEKPGWLFVVGCSYLLIS